MYYFLLNTIPVNVGMLKYVINSFFLPDSVFLPIQNCHESMKMK